MIQKNVLFHLESVFTVLRARMGEEATDAFLTQEYDDPIPEEWGVCLRSDDLMLSADSVLYRLLYYAGLKDAAAMEALVLRLFYLYSHANRLP